MSTILTGCRREVVGFFRRRESFWLMAAFGAGSAAPLCVLAMGPGSAEGGPLSGLGLETAQLAAEITHNYATVAEMVALALLAYSMAGRSLGQELERGSWPLLRLTPSSVERTLAGKAVGIAVVLAAVHGFAASLLFLLTPFLRRGPGEIAAATLGVLVLAIAAIPEGFAHAAPGRGRGNAAGLVRLASVVRYGVLLVGLPMLFGPPPRSGGSFNDLPGYWISRPARGPALPDTVLPWLFALSWLALSGAVLWKLGVRRWRTDDR